MQIGLDTYLGIGREAVAGTPVKAQALASFIPRDSMGHQTTTIESQSGSVPDRMLRDIKPGLWHEQGTLNVEVQPEGGFLVALLALMGAHADTGPTDLCYTHTFKTSGTPDPVTLVEIMQQETPYAHVYPGGYIYGMELGINKDGILEAALQAMAQKVWEYDATKGGTSWANVVNSFATSTSPTIPGIGLGISLDGGSTIDTDVLPDGNLGVASSIKPLHTLNRSRHPSRFGFGRQLVSGTFNKLFSTMDEVKKFFGLSSGALYTLQPGTVLGEYDLVYDWIGELAGTTTYYELKARMRKAKLIAYSAPIAGEEEIVQQLGWKAIYDSGSASDVEFTIVNKDAATYLDATGTAISVY